MSRRSLLIVACAAIAGVPALLPQAERLPDRYLPGDHPAIRYADAPRNDPVTRLLQRIEQGQAKLEIRKDGAGYLASLLENLGVNSDSQSLVFSKTSFQATRISPRNPRALYFSDDVSVGYVRDSNTLEITSLDPRQGVIFYTFDQKADPPRFDRRDVCQQCHQSSGTLGIPGLFISSVYPDSDGMPAFRGAQLLTDHRSKLQDRWGGWYVSGTHGSQRHLGNAVARDRKSPQALELRGTQNLTDLSRKFTPEAYLSQVSDIVALMTLEHQTHITNLLIRVGWEARMLQHEGEKKPQHESERNDEALRADYEADLDQLVAYMLFAGEAKLWEPIQGVSTFTETFPKRGPRDRQGRSLRDFDLQTRMFRHPLSYMIYSDAFDGLPDETRSGIYRRLYNVLSGNLQNEDQRKTFERLSAADRLAILEILRDTKPGLPDYWKSEAASAALR